MDPSQSWAGVVAAPAGARQARERLAAFFWRPVYFYLRRQGYDADASVALAKSVFEQARPGPRLRESLLLALDEIGSDISPSDPLIVDHATAEAHLSLLPEEPTEAFRQAWTAEIVRRALGTFYEECQREGRSDHYDILNRRYGWRMNTPEHTREERRARGRFREALRQTVASALAGEAEVDEELAVLGEALPSEIASCPRCGRGIDPKVVEQMFAGFCPGCLLQAGLDPAPPLEQIGAYEIVARLGQGAFGETYQARQAGGRDVLLRILAGPEEIEKARAAMRLRHPAIAAVYDAGTADGFSFVVFEKVDGQSVAEAAPFSRERAQEIVRVVAEGVHAAHETRLAHGRIEASNVVIDQDGRPHVNEASLAPFTPETVAADVAGLVTLLELCTGGSSADRGGSYSTVRDLLVSLDRGKTRRTGAPAAPQGSATSMARDRSREETMARERGSRIPFIVGAVFAVAAGAVGIGLLFSAFSTPSSPPTPPRPNVHESAGSPLEEALNRLEQARDSADTAGMEAFVRAWPQEVEGQVVLARALFSQQKFDEAEEGARRALRIDAKAGCAWRLLGLIAMERGDLTAAGAAFEKGREPYYGWRLPHGVADDAEERLAAALAAYIAGQPEKARAELSEAGRLETSPEVARWTGVILGVLGDPEANIQWQTQALHLRAEYVPAMMERGSAQARLGRHEAALADFEAVIRHVPQSFPALLQAGVALAQLERPARAKTMLTRALEIRRDVGLAWLTRAQVQGRLGDWTGALEDATEFLELERGHGNGHLERGRALWKLSRAGEAQEEFDLAVMADPRLRTEVERIRQDNER
ncbi:MAG: tetratricopeptide repeat protein [Planctomycetes bacterium]|nr:tetratricopeptide repeat protein [Planctomycetota bacterium]